NKLSGNNWVANDQEVTQFLISNPNGAPCVTTTGVSMQCSGPDPFGDLRRQYFNFILQENVKTVGGTAVTSNVAGIYQIHTVSASDYNLTNCNLQGGVTYLYCNGNPLFINLFEACTMSIPVIQTYNTAINDPINPTPDRTSIEEILNYSFLVEVVGIA